MTALHFNKLCRCGVASKINISLRTSFQNVNSFLRENKMDLTHIFKASVNALSLKQEFALSQPDKKLRNRQRDDFSRQVKNVCNKITTLRNILIENRSAYMRIGMHLKSSTQMTDEQRDLIDRESEKFVNFYTQHLAQLRVDWKKIKRKPQQRQHIECVLDLLSDYLKNVHAIFLEQKKYRVQHELETYRLLKLASDKKKIPVRPAGDKISQNGKFKTSRSSSTISLFGDGNNENVSVSSSDSDSASITRTPINQYQSLRRRHKHHQEESIEISGSNMKNETNISNDSKLQNSQSKVALDEEIQKQQLVEEGEISKKLSPEDIQMFEEENIQLYHELQGLSEEVEQIEKNVVDIANLQDIFTEKVSIQQYNIERIANAVVGSTENVKDANEQIMQAIQRNAGLRVWSLFFLLVMSFTLLFLDWYYD